MGERVQIISEAEGNKEKPVHVVEQENKWISQNKHIRVKIFF